MDIREYLSAYRMISSRRLCLIRRLPSESPEQGQRSKRENQAPGFFLAISDAGTVVMQ